MCVFTNTNNVLYNNILLYGNTSFLMLSYLNAVIPPYYRRRMFAFLFANRNKENTFKKIL